MAYFTGFMPTLLPPPAPLPSFHPAASIPFSFACPPNPSSSSAASAGPSSVSSSRHASLQARWPPPPVSSTARRPRASRPSGFGDGGAVESPRDDASVRARPSVHRDRLRHEHEGGLVRLLQGRAPLGVDLAAEKRDLSDEEQEVEYRDQVIIDYGHTFLVPIGTFRTKEEIEAVQPHEVSPTPPSNAEDPQPFYHNHAGGHGAHPGQQYHDYSTEVEDADEMADLDDDLEDEDAGVDDEDQDLEADESGSDE